MARYKQIEKEAVELHAQREKHSKRYAIIKAINKCTPLELFEGLVDGSFKREDLDHLFDNNNKASWQRLYSTIMNKKKGDILRKVLSHILSVSDNFITDIVVTGGNKRIGYTTYKTVYMTNTVALEAICDNWGDRVREIEDWEPKRNNPAMQLKSLINHLYAKYPVPDFLVNSFATYNQEGIYLFIHIGNGGSLKNFLFPPNLILNKKVYNHLFSTPEDYSFLEGFRRAQVLSMGGNEKLYAVIQQTQEIREGRNDAFWVTVIDLYVKAEMFDYNKIPEINDYIRHRILNQNPNAPYSMKGKNIEMLLNQSNRWHREEAERRRFDEMVRRHGQAAELRARRRLGFRYVPQTLIPNWRGSSIPDFHKTIKKKNVDYNYSIIQIKSHAGLIEEGSKMRHCVGSYASSCASGAKAIFSLREFGAPLVTIEVNGCDIVQMKAAHNSKPLEAHVNIIREWANKHNLGFGRYL